MRDMTKWIPNQRTLACVFIMFAGPAIICMSDEAFATSNACVNAVSARVRFTQAFKGQTPAYEVRVAAAEFLARHKEGLTSGTVIRNAEVTAFLEDVVADSLSPVQVASLSAYQPFLDSLVQSSDAVTRLRLMEAHDDGSGIPTNISDVLAPVVVATQAKSRGFLSSLKVWKKAEPKPSQSSLQFLNAEQFARALEEYPLEKRFDVFLANAASLPMLTHLEVFRILVVLPKESQGHALNAVRMIGRFDFFPLQLLESTVRLLDSKIIWEQLIKTSFNRSEILQTLRMSGVSDRDLLNMNAFEVFFTPENVDASLVRTETGRHEDATLDHRDGSTEVLVAFALQGSQSWQEALDFLLQIEKKMKASKENPVVLKEGTMFSGVSGTHWYMSVRSLSHPRRGTFVFHLLKEADKRFLNDRSAEDRVIQFLLHYKLIVF